MSKRKFYFITSISYDSTSNVILNTSQPITTCCDPEHFTLRFSKCATIPTGIESVQVKLNINGKERVVYNKLGEHFKGGDIVLTFNGCVDRRFTYCAAFNGTQAIISNAPKKNR